MRPLRRNYPAMIGKQEMAEVVTILHRGRSAGLRPACLSMPAFNFTASATGF